MQIRIGKFNEIPLYLYIPVPLQLIKYLLKIERPKYLAQLWYQNKPFNQLKAKYEGSISIISKEKMPNNFKYISWISLNYKIIVNIKYLVMPKIRKLFILWHEYGHYITKIYYINEYNTYEVVEAMASFYACCKLKLHFGTYIQLSDHDWFKDLINKCKDKLSYKWRVVFMKNFSYKRYADLYEKRYYSFNFTNNSSQLKMDEDDYVYLFYKNKKRLIDLYNFIFINLCQNDYSEYFDWNEFLTEIGWGNDEERWKYIDYFESKPNFV